MSECTHNCSTCGESCAERATPQSLRKAPHPESHIGKVFGVVSGKGGVGKSMVTSQLAVTLHRRGYKVGVMDADITGPSIPQAFGVHDKAVGTQTALYPCVSHSGIEVMSINLLLEDETDPVIWRGPVIGGVVQQFWTDVVWDVDYLFVDMPPGTGDVPLSVFQSIAAGRHHRRRLPAGACLHGRGEGREDGREDGGPHRRRRGEHELSRLPRLRQERSTSSARARAKRPPSGTTCPFWPRCPSTRSSPPSWTRAISRSSKGAWLTAVADALEKAEKRAE